MARGNQRDKAREKNQKEAASVVSSLITPAHCSSGSDKAAEEEEPSMSHPRPNCICSLLPESLLRSDP